MNMVNYQQILQQHALFSGLTPRQLQYLYENTRPITLKEGSYLVREGEITHDLFIILQGRVEVYKYDPECKRTYVIANLTEGDSVGEISLFDQGVCSASAKVITAVHALRISFQELQKLAEKDPNFNKFFFQIAKVLSARLRGTNEAVIQELEKRIEDDKLRLLISTFMVNIIIGFCIFGFIMTALRYFDGPHFNSTYVTIPLTISFMILTTIIMRNSHLPLSAFGVTLKNWRRSVKESLLFTFIIILIITGIKLLAIYLLPSMQSTSLFNFTQTVQGLIQAGWNGGEIWLMTLLLYCVLTSPLQELIARGALQGTLEVFLPGKHKKNVCYFSV